MAINAAAVRVALTGKVTFVPKGTTHTEPVDAVAPITGGVDLGYCTEDGVTIGKSVETEEIRAWQSLAAVRRLVTETTATVSFTLLQLDKNTLTAALGGKITATGTAPAVKYMWEPDDSAIVEGILYVDFKDGDKNYRYGFRRVTQSGEVEMQLVRNDAVTLPTEWTALAADGGKASMFILTDDPAFGVAA